MPSILNATTTSGLVTSADNSGSLQLQTNNGTTAVTIDTSQNVGVGTASPSVKLDVAGNSEAFRITPASGTASTSACFATFRNNGRIFYIGNDSSTGSSFGVADSSVMWNSAAAPLIFATSNTERMRIDSSGNVLLGSTNSSITAGVGFKYISDASNAYIGIVNTASTSGVNNYHLYSTGAGAYRFYVNLAGTIFATSTTISAISDQRLKENVRDLDVGLNELMSLKPRRFDWKEGKGQDKKDAVGFIAQEFETVFPNSVNTSLAGADGIEYKTICHEELIPTLVKAIQELKAELDATKAEVQALKGVA